eukprot:CAMPEP_0195293012 /NCGR_PEP_ID=MMETSP0707-20130614/11421_1 /TAXON_ID=33640 /ORGANISM="Asterionellopsis glacialis, Strain CCMP134" /LENGTH=244 /DNA_ID=CAMNT_0040353619 /DNA_START=258 /DNA_END=992 /DNA_ORIENTATION=-
MTVSKSHTRHRESASENCNNKARKCVRFPQDKSELEDVLVLRPCDSNQDEEEQNRQRRLLWYSEHDYRAFKRLAETTGKDAMKKGYGMFLKNTFKGAVASGSTADFTTTVSQTDQDDVNGWTLSSFRGLETYTCRSHGYTRYEAKLMQLKTVVSAQQYMMNKYGHVDSYTLCQIAEKHSYVARQFAYSLGKADENILKPQRLLPSLSSASSSSPTTNGEYQEKSNTTMKRTQFIKQQSWSSLAA